MTGFAIALVIAAAFIHAGWNLLAKRSSGGAEFIFLIHVCSVVLYAPIVVPVLWAHQSPLNRVTVLFIVGSAVIHVLYFLILQRGYQVGDLSLVYPLARGSGPLISTVVAIALLGERPTPLAVLGILLIVGGVLVITGDPYKLWASSARTAIMYGLLTGTLIAGYTICDKYAVSQYHISPMVLNYGCICVEAVLLLPIAVRRWPHVRTEWQTSRLEILGVAWLSPLAYVLVLIAMTFTSVSHVAPMRELGILIGTILGNRLLDEGEASRRLVAAGVMLSGIVLLAAN